MEKADVIAVVCVVLAVVLAIYSTPIRDWLLDTVGSIGDAILFLVEAGLLITVIAAAIYGQNISRA